MGTADILNRLRDLGFQEIGAPALSFERVRLEPHALQVTGTRPALGTLVVVTTVAPAADAAEDAIAAAFAELDRLVGIFSRHEPDSALTALNDRGQLEGPPPELVRVLERARYFHALSRGAFDVTVKPVLDLLGLRFPANPPAPGELRDAAALVGAQHLSIRRRKLRFARANMGVTLDGIAKGYIVDRMADVLACHGIRRALINAGGDIRACGSKHGGRPWTVGVRAPGRDGVVPDAIALRDAAVATSGGYERFFDPKRQFHHIIDPASGVSPAAAWSVSVAAPTALVADALATTVFVLGPEPGLRLLETLPDCAGFVVTEGGRQRQSRRWGRLRISQEESVI